MNRNTTTTTTSSAQDNIEPTLTSRKGTVIDIKACQKPRKAKPAFPLASCIEAPPNIASRMSANVTPMVADAKSISDAKKAKGYLPKQTVPATAIANPNSAKIHAGQ